MSLEKRKGVLALLERTVRKCLLTLDKPPASPGTALGSLIWTSKEKAWVPSPAVPAFHLRDLTRSHSSTLQTLSPAAREGFSPTGVPWQFLVQWRAGECTGSQHMISSYFISFQVLNNFNLLSLWTQKRWHRMENSRLWVIGTSCLLLPEHPLGTWPRPTLTSVSLTYLICEMDRSQLS